MKVNMVVQRLFVVLLMMAIVAGSVHAEDAYEVTVSQFKKFLKSSGYEPGEPINWNGVYE